MSRMTNSTGRPSVSLISQPVARDLKLPTGLPVSESTTSNVSINEAARLDIESMTAPSHTRCNEPLRMEYE